MSTYLCKYERSNFWLKSPSYFEVPPLTFKNNKIFLLKFTSLDMLMTWISSLLVYQKHTCLVLWLDQLLAVSLERTFRDLCMGTDSGLKLQTQDLVSLKASHFNTTIHKKKNHYWAHSFGMYELELVCVKRNLT